MPEPPPVVRDARTEDVPAVCLFGETHIPPHYAPLIGGAAAEEQVRRWWAPGVIAAAVEAGLVVVAEAGRAVGAGTGGADAGGVVGAGTGGADAGGVVGAGTGGAVVGVAQWGRSGTDHAVYKLYVSPPHRGTGLGPRLLAAVVERLPDDAERLCVEHFAGNARAGAFYEREGFAVERVEPAPSGDPALAVVWRGRLLRPPS